AVTIMLAFGAQGEAIQAAGGADGVKAVLPAGEQLVDVALMTDIPDEFVLRRGEDGMQRDGQLHHAEIRTEVTAVPGKDRDELVAEFLRQLLQLVQLEFLDVFRAVHHVEISVHRPRREGLEQWSNGVMELWRSGVMEFRGPNKSITKSITPSFHNSTAPWLCPPWS